MNCRGIRGAIGVDDNSVEAILGATRQLLSEIIRANDLRSEDIASAIFTTTKDLDAVYPARAAREMGWQQVPLLCLQELDVQEGGIKRCIRTLIHWNTDRTQDEVRHIFLGRAGSLRPDLIKEGDLE